MTEEDGRVAVVSEAMSWLGTPFVNQGDVRGVGVDCAMLCVRSFVDTGILPPFDPRPYPPLWMLHQSEEKFLGWIQSMGEETDEVRSGNVVLYKWGLCYSHSGIIVDEQNIVHAWFIRGEVMLSPLFDIKLTHYPKRPYNPRPRKIFDVWKKIRS